MSAYCPKCKTCDGDGVLAASECSDCHGTGEIDWWRECSYGDYARAVIGAGGLDNLTPLAGYTCVEGDAFTYGRRIETTWGTRDGTPVAHSVIFNEDPRAARETDSRGYFVWDPSLGRP